jgi:hypothetical protein
MLPIIAAYKKAATTSPMIVPIGGPARLWSTGVGIVGTSSRQDYCLFLLSPDRERGLRTPFVAALLASSPSA